MSAETRLSSNRPTSAVVLESLLRERLGSQVPDLTVEANDGQLVVCGRVNTYYALQLTLTAVNKMLREAVGELPQEISIAVRVGDVARELQFVCRKHEEI